MSSWYSPITNWFSQKATDAKAQVETAVEESVKEKVKPLLAAPVKVLGSFALTSGALFVYNKIRGRTTNDSFVRGQVLGIANAAAQYAFEQYKLSPGATALAAGTSTAVTERVLYLNEGTVVDALVAGATSGLVDYGVASAYNAL